MKKILLLLLFIFGCDITEQEEDCTGISGGNSVEDIDGNCYETIQIGDQLWMAENLKVTHYNDGDEMQYVQSESSEPDVWANLYTGAFGYYNDDPSHLDTYGNIYNWFAVNDDRGVCPEGWHIPSHDEWKILTNIIAPEGIGNEGSNSIAGGKMKSTGTLESGDGLWYYYSDEITEEATNESGFSGLPGAARMWWNGTYGNIGNDGTFWSSYGINNGGWYRQLNYNSSVVNSYVDISGKMGFSIRCLKNN